MNGIDAVATAIMYYEGDPGFRPPARSWRNCNPGNLRSPSWPTKDADGFDVYPDVITGYEKLWDDLASKFDGNNDHGLGQHSTIAELMSVYAPASDGNAPAAYATWVASVCTAALGFACTPQTPLAMVWMPPTPTRPATAVA